MLLGQVRPERQLDLDLAGLDAFVHDRIDWNRRIYDDCINLNPAGNVMNPRAEAVLSAGLSSHPSLGHAGAKYETGLEAVEEIEVVAADLAVLVSGDGDFAEVGRVVQDLGKQVENTTFHALSSHRLAQQADHFYPLDDFPWERLRAQVSPASPEEEA